MVGGSLRVLRLLPPLKLVAEILLKVVLKRQKSNQSIKLLACVFLYGDLHIITAFLKELFPFLTKKNYIKKIRNVGGIKWEFLKTLLANL